MSAYVTHGVSRAFGSSPMGISTSGSYASRGARDERPGRSGYIPAPVRTPSRIMSPTSSHL